MTNSAHSASLGGGLWASDLRGCRSMRELLAAIEKWMGVQGSFSRANGALLQDDSFGVGEAGEGARSTRADPDWRGVAARRGQPLRLRSGQAREAVPT